MHSCAAVSACACDGKRSARIVRSGERAAPAAGAESPNATESGDLSDDSEAFVGVSIAVAVTSSRLRSATGQQSCRYLACSSGPATHSHAG